MRTVIITGGNSGLGFETAKKIAKNKEYRVILACRNPQKAEEAVTKIKEETGNENILSMRLDTAFHFAFSFTYLLLRKDAEFVWRKVEKLA